jgi:c-di-AMP phosphodiesterase-like protein
MNAIYIMGREIESIYRKKAKSLVDVNMEKENQRKTPVLILIDVDDWEAFRKKYPDKASAKIREMIKKDLYSLD